MSRAKKVLTVFKTPLTTPLLLTLFFTSIFAYRSIYRHLSFESNAFDLGIYTQAIYLYSQELSPFSTLKNMNILADHFGVILLVLSPIYKLFPSAITLLTLQALFVGLSSIPIYLIAKHELKNGLLSFLITVSYLVSSGIISAIHFDFHLATISVLPLSLMLYFWYFKKYHLYWLVLFLGLLFKEDIPLFILGLGLFQLTLKQFRLGISTIIFSLISVYLIKFQIMPSLWTETQGAYISTSILPLTSPVDLLLLLFINPKIYLDIIFNSPLKFLTIDTLYRQFAFLPILSPLSWLAVFPYLYIRFSSNLNHLWGTNWHYNANLEPFLAISAILAISKFKFPLKPISILLIFFLITGHLSPNGPVWTTFFLNIRNTAVFDYINQSLENIPANSAVSAQSPLVPHLANRKEIYMFPEVKDARYIILDSSLGSYPLDRKDLIIKIADLKKSTDWKVELENNSLVIFKKQ